MLKHRSMFRFFLSKVRNKKKQTATTFVASLVEATPEKDPERSVMPSSEEKAPTLTRTTAWVGLAHEHVMTMWRWHVESLVQIC